jgi:NO-binding membrane sensor protein with MHYT domain
MLLGYGIRGGSAGRVFAAIGAILSSTGGGRLPILLGVAVQVAVALACGVLYVALTKDKRENRFAWAIAIGAGVAAITFVVVRAFAGSIALVLTPGNLVALGVVIAITLPIGMRFAFSRK